MTAVPDYTVLQSILKQQKIFQSAKTKEFKGHRSKVHSISWSKNGTQLATGSTDNFAKVWSISSTNGELHEEWELKGHLDSVDQLCWDPVTNNRLATASVDKTVRIWDSSSGQCIKSITTGGENINICWSPDGNQIAVGSKDDHVKFIDLRTFEIIHSLDFPYEINEIGWNPDGSSFFLTTGQGTVSVIDTKSYANKETIYAHTANCYCLEFDPTGKYFATGGADAIVALWTISDFVCAQTFCKLNWPVRTISFSFDSQYIASGSEDLFIDISHVDTASSVHKIVCNAPVNTVSWHPSKHLLAYAGDEIDKYGKAEGNIKIFGFEN